MNIAPDHRGKGLGRGVVRTQKKYSDTATVRLWMLGAADAYGVYAEIGFGPLKASQRLMEVIKPAH